MTIKVTIEPVDRIGDNIYKARVNAADLAILGAPVAKIGSCSVLLVQGVDHDVSESSISFEPAKANLLNLGTQSVAIIIDSPQSEEAPVQQGNTAVRDGDQAYLEALNKLPDNINQLGRDLLNGVRRFYNGKLVFKEISGRYVESPDNFWTVRPQPRDGSLRITVMGTPERFSQKKELNIKEDRGSYSNFKINDSDQLESALEVIREAWEIKISRKG